MYETTTKKNGRALLVAALALMLALILALLAGRGLAKYRTQVVVTGQINYFNQLSRSFVLRESKVSADELGALTVTETPTEQNTYYLIPGTTLPQDPAIVITHKSSIPAYLYLLVEGDPVGAAIDEERWTSLGEVTSPVSGKLYVYPAVLDGGEGGEDGTLSIPILSDEPQAALSKNPAELPAPGSFKLTGYMIQLTGDAPAYDQAAALALFEDAFRG